MLSDYFLRRDIPFLSLPGGSEGKESACNAGDQVGSLGREDPPEKGMATLSSILAWEIPWTEKPGWLQSLGLQRVLAWEISWTEEPGWLQAMGLQRVGHD